MTAGLTESYYPACAKPRTLAAIVMSNSLTSKVKTLTGDPTIQEHEELVQFINGILRFSDDDRTIAYGLGLLFTKKEFPFDKTSTNFIDAITFIEKNNLSYFYELKERPKTLISNPTAIVLALFGLALTCFTLLTLLRDISGLPTTLSLIDHLLTPISIFVLIGLMLTFASTWKIIQNTKRKHFFDRLEKFNNSR